MIVEYELTQEDYSALAWYRHSQPGSDVGKLRGLRYGFAGVCLMLFLIKLALGSTPGDFVWLVLAVLWFCATTTPSIATAPDAMCSARCSKGCSGAQ